MQPSGQLEQCEQQFLPIVARTFAELGYEGATLACLAQRCGISEAELTRLWPDKTNLFIAALEYAYEVAERTWAMLLHPDPPLQVAERMLAFASRCGDDFSVSHMLSAGLDEAGQPRIRNTLRRLNRRFARFLAGEVAMLRLSELGGADTEVSLRSQAGTVLRQLAHIQQEADALADNCRQEMLDELNASIQQARSAAGLDQPHLS